MGRRAMNKPTILLLGANGVIGRKIAEKLQSNGPKTYHLIRHMGRRPLPIHHHDDSICSFDLGGHPNGYRSYIDSANIIIHCAHEDYRKTSTSLFLEHILCLPPRNLEAILYIGTAATYNLGEKLVSEPTPKCNAPTPYIRFKRNAEIILSTIAYELGISVSVIQPGIVTADGTAQWEQQAMVDLLSGSPALPLKGSGTCNICSVERIAEIVSEELAAKREGYSERLAYELSGPISWQNFYMQCARHINIAEHRIKIRHAPKHEPSPFQSLRRRFSLRRQLSKFLLGKKRTFPIKVLLWVMARTSIVFTCPPHSGYERALLESQQHFQSIMPTPTSRPLANESADG